MAFLSGGAVGFVSDSPFGGEASVSTVAGLPFVGTRGVEGDFLLEFQGDVLDVQGGRLDEPTRGPQALLLLQLH